MSIYLGSKNPVSGLNYGGCKQSIYLITMYMSIYLGSKNTVTRLYTGRCKL
jgi:hypothetical protein